MQIPHSVRGSRVTGVGILNPGFGTISFPTGRVGLVRAGGEPLFEFCRGNSANVSGRGPPSLPSASSQIVQKLGKWVTRGTPVNSPSRLGCRLSAQPQASAPTRGVARISAYRRAGLSLRRFSVLAAALAPAPPRVVRRWPSRHPLGEALPFTTALVTFS